MQVEMKLTKTEINKYIEQGLKEAGYLPDHYSHLSVRLSKSDITIRYTTGALRILGASEDDDRVRFGY